MNKTLSLVFFGIFFIMSLFMLYPETSSVNLTDEGTERLGFFTVNNSWEESGTLTNLETDGDIIYPATSQTGSWESFVIEGDDMDIIDLGVQGDIRDGTINASILLYESSDSLNGADRVLNTTVDSPDFNYTFESIADQYDFFKVRLELTEDAGSSNQRPSVDSVSVNYLENLDRQGLGFDEYSFQLFVLFVFIGLGLLGLLKEVIVQE